MWQWSRVRVGQPSMTASGKSSAWGAGGWQRGSASWEDLSEQAKSASTHYRPQRKSCSSLQGGRWRSGKAAPRSGAKEALFCRNSRCQYPRETSQEPCQGHRPRPSGSPRPRRQDRRRGCSDARPSATSRCLQRTPSFGVVRLAEMCRSAKTTGGRASGVARGQARSPGGGRRPRLPSSPALLNRASISYSTSPTGSPGCLARRPETPPGLALKKIRACSYWNSWCAKVNHSSGVADQGLNMVSTADATVKTVL